MAHKIQLRRDTSAVWAAVNPILADGEMGLETDTRYLKFGDGSTPWNGLGYCQAGPTGPTPLSLSGTPSATGTVGTPYSFTPSISGGVGPYTVTLISGALPAGLTLNSTTGAITGTPTTATSYTPILRVTDSTGATDNLALGTITIGAGSVATAPTISVQPSAQSVTAPAAATFNVTATGTAPLSYQWRKNGSNISGATSASYTTPATTTGDSGATFDVVVTNSSGSVTSSTASLTVSAGAVAPSITVQPSGQTVTAPGTATFNVTATGTAPLTYQWRKGGVNISGATSSSYTTPATTTGDTGSAYSVVVTNSAGSVTSSSATLTVNAAATVPGAPTGVTATAGNASASVSFSAPSSNGGASITGYTVTSSPGGITATGSAGPINVTGLTNGTAYTFTVHATNSVGDSVESSASSAVTPAVPVDTRPRFFVAPSTAGSSGQQAFIDGATKFGSNGGKAGSFSLVTTAGNYGWYVALASAGTPTFTSASAPGFPGGWTSQGTFAATQGSMQLWRQDFPNANPTPGDTWTVS